MERWQVRIQSSLIMEQESSASRASSLASDLYQIGRAMTTEELESVIESLTLDQSTRLLDRQPAQSIPNRHARPPIHFRLPRHPTHLQSKHARVS